MENQCRSELYHCQSWRYGCSFWECHMEFGTACKKWKTSVEANFCHHHQSWDTAALSEIGIWSSELHVYKKVCTWNWVCVNDGSPKNVSKNWVPMQLQAHANDIGCQAEIYLWASHFCMGWNFIFSLGLSMLIMNSAKVSNFQADISSQYLRSNFLAESCYKMTGKKWEVRILIGLAIAPRELQHKHTNVPCFIHLAANYSVTLSHTSIQGQHSHHTKVCSY